MYFTALITALTIMLRVFPKEDDVHSVILMYVVPLVNMNDI